MNHEEKPGRYVGLDPVDDVDDETPERFSAEFVGSEIEPAETPGEVVRSDSAPKIELAIDPFGHGSVKLGGIEIGSYTRRIELDTEVGGGTRVVIHLAHGVEISALAEAVSASIVATGDEPE